ncbi:MAG: alpha-amylase family glycosyl hydrolase [Bacteroidota bacterium]
MNKYSGFLLACFALTLNTIAQTRDSKTWSKNAVIYEVNVRQYSQKGDFNSVTQSIPRLKNLGVDVLWIMPVHPIGEEKRKGGMGSYYSVKDYRGIDPSYGTHEDFRNLVNAAHQKGMKVIIDWVANHTAWDHEWIKLHPDWYVKNDNGDIQTQYDWSDVAKLNYAHPEMRNAMTDEMQYWVREFDIDGFRCDVAFLVPLEFWEENRNRLEQLKPMFMLAEMEWNTDITSTPGNYFNTAFDAAYGWNFMGVTQDMAKQKKSLIDFRKEMKDNYTKFPSHMLKLFFITNHDENSWNGTVTEKYGNDWKLYSALCYTLPQSFPLIYSGEEAGLNRRLSFFEKDPILDKEWKDTSRYGWYRDMTQLKHQNKALWNTPETSFTELEWTVKDTTISNHVYAFTRKNGAAEVTVLINFGNTSYKLKPINWNHKGGKNIYSHKVIIDPKKIMTIPAHSVWINYKN